jgi:hypothetical protein
VLAISRVAREFTFWRVIGAALVLAAVMCVIVLGALAYYAVAANRGQDVPASPAVNAAFAEARRSWVRHMDIPVHRLALSSAEEYGSGNYLFVFDVYTWVGIGSGYMTHASEERGCGGGGIVRYSEFAGIGIHSSDTRIQDARAQCIRAYGPGRLVAPVR